MNKLISIIIPVYNEEGSILSLYEDVKAVLRKLSYDHEIIFINDGSDDKSQDIILDLSNKDSFVKYVEFSRNFGKEAATSAGLHNVSGSAAIIMDSDFQHPPFLIPKFIEKWENGSDVVICVRNNNNGNVFNNLGSHIFYKIMNFIGETKIIPRATDFRLVDRKVIDEFNKFTERQRMTRGILDWIGFKRDYIYFDAAERKFGRAQYGFIKKTKLAMSSFIANSLIPLKLAGYLGVLITLSSGLLGVFIIIEKYILQDPWNMNFSGIFALSVFVSFLMGTTLVCLGLIALYIANIQVEVTNRPLYVIRKKSF